MTAERAPSYSQSALDLEAGPIQPSSTDSGGSLGSSYGQLLSLCLTGPKALTQEVWRRIKLEVVVELPMLKQRWLIIVFGIIMQYVHGIFTQLAHRMHKPQEEPLHDIGFALTPELGPDKHWVSEAIFGTLFAMFAIWTFTPFVLQRKRFYTVVMWSRLLMVLVVCQALRIITFTVTQLPGPSFHCRAGEPTAVRPWPKHWSGHIVVDVQRQVSKSCGDLIFSSHTTFLLTGILAYTEYGSWLAMKGIAWLCGLIVSFLIVASRKHYTVDVVVAWYTVPLVFYTLHRRWTTRRPMSELLGALGENDEPDPDTPSDGRLSDSGGGLMFDQVQVIADKADVKALLSHPKERASSSKLNGLSALEGAGESDPLLPAPSGGLTQLHGKGGGMANGSHHTNGAAGIMHGSSITRPRSLVSMAEAPNGHGDSNGNGSAGSGVYVRLEDRLRSASLTGKPHSSSSSGCRIS